LTTSGRARLRLSYPPVCDAGHASRQAGAAALGGAGPTLGAELERRGLGRTAAVQLAACLPCKHRISRASQAGESWAAERGLGVLLCTYVDVVHICCSAPAVTTFAAEIFSVFVRSLASTSPSRKQRCAGVGRRADSAAATRLPRATRTGAGNGCPLQALVVIRRAEPSTARGCRSCLALQAFW